MSYLICFGLFVLIVILVMYLTHGSEVWQELMQRKNRILDSCGAIKRFRNVKIANGPVLCVKCPGELEYRQIPILTRTTKLGSSRSSEVVLKDEFVEPIHAIVRKVVHEDDCHYELINMSKYNPVQWFNQDTNDYETIRYKRGVVLDSQEVFYIGESKVMVKCPVAKHKPSKTERLVLMHEGEKADKQENGMVETSTKRVPGSQNAAKTKRVERYTNQHLGA